MISLQLSSKQRFGLRSSAYFFIEPQTPPLFNFLPPLARPLDATHRNNQIHQRDIFRTRAYTHLLMALCVSHNCFLSSVFQTADPVRLVSKYMLLAPATMCAHRQATIFYRASL